MKPLIPWARPIFWGNEQQYVAEASTSSWISGGPFVERLEREFAAYCSSAHALSAANGTAALHMAYLALGIGPGDEIVIPGFGFLGAANIALHMHAQPVFCEVDPRTWCMRAKDIEPVLTEKTRAIVAVHTYGNVCEMDDILELASERKISVIEDAAEAFPSRYRGRVAGTMGTIGTFSFRQPRQSPPGKAGWFLRTLLRFMNAWRFFAAMGCCVNVTIGMNCRGTISGSQTCRRRSDAHSWRNSTRLLPNADV